MADLKIMSAGAVKPMVAALGAEFEERTASSSNSISAPPARCATVSKNGEAADLVILSQSAIATLAKLDLVIADSISDSPTPSPASIVRAGAKRPDISTPEAFKQALLDARSVAYTDPKAGGSSGTMFAAMLEKLGIAEAINKKAVLGKGGHDVAVSVAEGRAEFGTTFISEVLPVPGVQVVGPLPGDLHNANTYTAGNPCRQRAGRGGASVSGGIDRCRRSARAGSPPGWSRRFSCGGKPHLARPPPPA